MIKQDGTSIGDNVANLSYKKMAVKLLGNLTISGKVFLPNSVTSSGLLPTINCYDFNTNQLVSSTVPNASTGLYTLTNIEENTRYKIELKFPQDSLASLRDRAVTITDAVKSFNEFTSTDVNLGYGRQYLKHPLSYLIGDINLTGTLDGGDPYGIYASVSGLKPIDLTKLINVFKKEEYDSLVLSNTTWSKGSEVLAYNFIGNMNIEIPNQYVVGQPLNVPFRLQTNGLQNTGLQFEMSYDINKVKFEGIQSNLGGPWLQYVNHDPQKGVVRFGGMNNQKTGALIGAVTPFNLKFTAINPSEDISTSVFNMEIGLPKQTVLYASIYDMGGKEVINLGKIQPQDFDSKIIKRLDVRGLPGGLYQLVVFDSRNKTTKQFIKI